jgi:Tfp pilus assembly protein PilF
MSKRFVTVIAILGAIMIICSSPAFTAVWARVNGSVKTEDGKPIEGARVILIFSDGAKEELTTDKKGNWSKVDLRPGQWTIGVMADGYKPDNVVVVLSAIKKNPPVDIKLALIPEPPLSKGDNLYRQKKYAEALKEYQRVLAENPDLYQVHDKIGLCYHRLNDLDNAVKAFKLMLEKDPGSRSTLINISAIYLEKGNLEEGMKYVEQLDEESIKDPKTFYNIGVILFNKNRMDTAVDYFKKCVARDPNYVDGYYQLALAYLNKGDMEKAKINLQKVIQLAPGSEKAALAKEMVSGL